MNEFVVLLGAWILSSFVLGFFAGRFIKVGSYEPTRRVANCEALARRQQFSIAHRRIH